RIVFLKILLFIALLQVCRRKRLKADEQTAQTCGGSFFDHVTAQNCVDSGSCLEDPVHTLHSFEQLRCESCISKKMVVKEVKVPARKAVNFRQRIVHHLGIKALSPLEEGILVTKVTVMRTA